MILELQDIFIAKNNKHLYTKQDLLLLPLKTGFIDSMSNHFNLTFVENNHGTDNLCFVNGTEVMPEYKAFYDRTDIVHYVFRNLKKDCYDLLADQVPFPKDISTFWKRSKT